MAETNYYTIGIVIPGFCIVFQQIHLEIYKICLAALLFNPKGINSIWGGSQKALFYQYIVTTPMLKIFDSLYNI